MSGIPSQTFIKALSRETLAGFLGRGDMSQGGFGGQPFTPFGNSHLYINPNDAGDHIVSPGDWIRGRPGVANSSQVRQALDNLAAYNIIVPVWDMAQGNGE